MRLAQDVYVASVEGDLIFLDARHDRYSCITRSDAASVLALLDGEGDDALSSDVAQELVEAGPARLVLSRPRPASPQPPIFT